MRHLAVVLAAALVFAMIAPAFAQPFSDVPTNHWAYDAIAELAAKGLVEGYPDGTFRGDRTVTRYEMAMIVARLLARVESIQIPAPQAPQVTRTDVASISRLVNEFRAELAALGVRVTAIEEELNAIKARLDNVRITGAWRFRYNDIRTGTTNFAIAGVNGNPQLAQTDASGQPFLTQAIQEVSVAFDGSVAPNVHFVLKLISDGAGGFTNFNSSTFGVGSGQDFASIDGAYFDWKNAWGWPIEMKLGRQGCSASSIGRCEGVVFGPFGLLMDTTADIWRESTKDSNANAADGFWIGGHHSAILDLRWQATILRVNTGSNYANGEDAYGFDANVEIIPGLRVGASYVTNSIYETTPNTPTSNFQPSSLSGVAGISDPNQWHLYGPASHGVSAPGPNCITIAGGTNATAGIACPAVGSGWDGYVQWNIVSGIHLDGEYAGWTDQVHNVNDTGYRVNVHVDLGTWTGLGHNFGLDVGYVNFGQNFIPPYGNTMADKEMLGNLYPSNEQGFKGRISYDLTSAWTLYGVYFGGNTVSNGQQLSEYEVGVVYKFAPSASIVFKTREERVANIEQFQLYRAQIDYKF